MNTCFLIEQIDPEMLMDVSLQVNTDNAALADAVKKIIAAHPSVNVHFEFRDDEIMQVTNKNAEPLYQFEIVKTPAPVSLFVDFHHLIFDGASMNLFLANLKTVLDGGTLEREGASYFDFVRGKTDGETKIFDAAISAGVEAFCRENRLTPDATALIAADGTFTYRQLDEAANRIANALLARGIKPQSRVDLLLPRTSRAIISMFGVLKAGCAYIPCYTEYPAERIKQILDDSAAILCKPTCSSM